ncbi:AAEL014020-PA [Aedes aegypti]|uniref:Uncharacterized protein n=3 Tax=Aedes aegypti TaxID=7159 RepID=Q16HH6_AEDAE|nr:uncharacterized protein LOC5579148 [Aedes aegypti]XP_021696612.1 uncharacterized protein LOC5579148 [Aedes aegypti]XP_021696613.1 uncharacterized protein LOC5579148 [Aedes aegypti]EAT33706.1 AAEL014020-PA [Aedes aegypti]
MTNAGDSNVIQQHTFSNDQLSIEAAHHQTEPTFIKLLHQTEPTPNVISVIPTSSAISNSEPGCSKELSSVLHVASNSDGITFAEIGDDGLSQQNNAENAPLVNDDTMKSQIVELLIEETEITCPNIVNKRNQEEVKVFKSSKKFASSELKFRYFQINWCKISDNTISRLNELQKYRNENTDKCAPRQLQLSKTDWSNITNSVVDQMRSVDTEIKASVMEKVAKDILDKYPCLNVLDDDGFGSGKDYVAVKHKMLNRNSYLNRFKEDQDQPTPSKMKDRQSRNVRAGTNKEYWKQTNNECTKDMLSSLSRNETELLTQEFLQASQSYVRYRFDENKPLKEVVADFPVLRRKCLLDYHFECATGVAAGSMEKYFAAKRQKLIEFSKSGRKTTPLTVTASDVDIIQFLCSLLGEKCEDVIVSKEIGTRIDDITTECSGPVLVAVDCGNEKTVYYVFAEQVRLSEGTENVIAAISDLVCVHYVHNFMYMQQISKFLEFVQEYFFKILPTYGSKSNATRKGQQQRIVKKVIKMISEYCAQ